MITIIGNGESRKDINIDNIKGMKVGCNGIYLHNSVDLICAMDKFWRDKIEKECNIPLLSRKINQACQMTLQLYKNGQWSDTNCKFRGYCSGITALDYICSLYDDEIYLIGFDFAYSGPMLNHIYKDTKFHPRGNKPAQSSTLFLKQCQDTIKRYPRKKIYWVTNEDMNIGIPLIKIYEYLKLMEG